jgi:autotransporter-associated beta strand protein
LTIGSSLGSATLDLNSTAQNFRNLSFLSGSGSIVSGVLGIGTAGNAGTVTVTGSNHLISSAVTLNDAATFNVNAASRLNVSSQISGAGQSLTKTGLGILELSGSNSYDGPTNVSAGGLLVNGRLESSVVTVQSGGLLGGSGYLGDVTVLAGGTFSPGNSPGLINVANLSLAGTTLMELEGLTRGTEYDAANVTSTLTYGGAMVIDFGSFANTALPDNTSFNLFDFGSYTGLFSGITTSSNASWYAGLTFSGTGDKRTATVGAQTLEFTHSTGILLVVPEPATIALAGIAAACAGFVAYRRRRPKA